MKRFLPIPIALGAVAAFLASSIPAFSADTGTVNAKVTPAAPCLTLSVSAIDFGIAAFSTFNAPVSVENNQISFTNCGLGPEFVAVRATNPTGPQGSSAAWTVGDSGLVPSCPVDTNVVHLRSDGTPANLPPVFANILTVNQYFYQVGNPVQVSFPPGLTTPTKTTLGMPCTGSSGSGMEMSFQIIYTATF